MRITHTMYVRFHNLFPTPQTHLPPTLIPQILLVFDWFLIRILYIFTTSPTHPYTSNVTSVRPVPHMYCVCFKHIFHPPISQILLVFNWFLIHIVYISATSPTRWNSTPMLYKGPPQRTWVYAHLHACAFIITVLCGEIYSLV